MFFAGGTGLRLYARGVAVDAGPYDRTGGLFWVIVFDGDGERMRPSRESCDVHEYGDDSIASFRVVRIGSGGGAREDRIVTAL